MFVNEETSIRREDLGLREVSVHPNRGQFFVF